MSGACPEPVRLLESWEQDRQTVAQHVLSCENCRQTLMITASLRAIQVEDKPPTASFHIWRMRLQDRVEREGRATWPISVMYFLMTVLFLTFLLFASSTPEIFSLADWLPTTRGWILENELALYVGGTLMLAFVMVGLLRLEEE